MNGEINRIIARRRRIYNGKQRIVLEYMAFCFCFFFLFESIFFCSFLVPFLHLLEVTKRSPKGSTRGHPQGHLSSTSASARISALPTRLLPLLPARTWWPF